MIITVEHNGTKIIADSSDTSQDRMATFKYSDQNKMIQETIQTIAEQVIKLQEATQKEG